MKFQSPSLNFRAGGEGDHTGAWRTVNCDVDSSSYIHNRATDTSSDQEVHDEESV